MTDSENTLPLQRASRLEALRGLAALQVALFHCLLVLESSSSSQRFVKEAIVLFNGRAAVTLFFVLSGLVLGLSLRRSTGSFKDVFFSYAIRRIFRIYPAFLIATLLVCCLIPLYGWCPPSGSQWIDDYFPRSFGLRTILTNIFFISHSLNNVTWTLRMEMLCSLLLPFCFFGSLRFRFFPWVLLLVSIVAGQIFPTVISVLVTQAFLVGYLIPTSRKFWPLICVNSFMALSLTAGGFAVLVLARSAHDFLNLGIITLIEAIGAGTVIGCVTYGFNARPYALLDNHFIKIAGRASFSYYLFHPIILIPVSILIFHPLLELTSFNHPLFCAFVLWTVSSAIALPMGCYSYEYIERRMIAYSKSLFTDQQEGISPAIGHLRAEPPGSAKG